MLLKILMFFCCFSFLSRLLNGRGWGERRGGGGGYDLVVA